MSIEHKAIAGLKSTALARLAGQLASWASTLLVFRLLVPEDYGLMAIVATLAGIGTAIAEFGLGASMIQARELDRSLLSRLAGLVLLLHAGMALLMVIAGPLCAWIYAEPRLAPLLQAASLQFVFAGLAAVPYAMAVRAMSFGWLARVELLTMVLGSLGTLGLAMLGAGVWSLIGGLLLSAGARALLLVAGGDNVRPSFRLAGLREHLEFSAKMASTHVLWTVVSQSDVLIGGRLLSRDALGLYSVALHLATLPMQKVMGVVNQIVFAAVARLQDEGERLRMRVLQGTRIMMAAAVGVMWGLGAVAPELVPLVIGAQWEAAVVPLQLISVVVPLRMLAMLLATAVAGAGAIDVNLRNTLSAAVIWPPCMLLGAHWGATGLAAAWLLASPLTFALNARRIGTALSIRVPELLRLAAAPAVAGLALWAGVVAVRSATLTMPTAPRLGLLIVVGAAAYSSALLLIDRSLWPDLRRFALAARRS